MSREESARLVEDRDPASCEQRERREPVLDAVERLRDVDPPERESPGASARRASSGESSTEVRPVRGPLASSRFVGLARWVTMAKRIVSGIVGALPPARGISAVTGKVTSRLNPPPATG